MVVVALGLEVDHERRVALEAQRRRGQERAVEALHAALAQRAARRAAALAAHVVFEAVQEALDAPGRSESAQERRLAAREAEVAALLQRAGAGAALTASGL